MYILVRVGLLFVRVGLLFVQPPGMRLVKVGPKIGLVPC